MMETNNDKAVTVDTPELAKLMISWVEAKLGLESLDKYQAVIAHIDAWQRAVTEKAVAEKDAEIEALHRRLAGETLRADQGWSRYEAANADRNQLRSKVAELDGWLSQRPCRKDRCLEYVALETKLAAQPQPAPVAATEKPFMYAIMEPNGSAYMDEFCVAGNAEDLHSTLNGLNDSPDTGYSIVPVYLAAPHPAPVAAMTDERAMEIAWRFQAGGDDGKFVILSEDFPHMVRTILAAQQPAADSRATGNDGELPDYPPLPWREEDGSHDFEAWLESRCDMDVAQAFWDYARTYGQQCSDAALERAAEVCVRTSPNRDMVRRLGESSHYIACRDAIRALKGGK